METPASYETRSAPSSYSTAGDVTLRGTDWDHALNGTDKPLGVDRLGDIGVHTGSKATVLVALHGVRGHGDDWNMVQGASSGRAFAAADFGGGLEAVHIRHLYVHQDEVEALSRPGLHGFAAVGSYHHRVPLFL